MEGNFTITEEYERNNDWSDQGRRIKITECFMQTFINTTFSEENVKEWVELLYCQISKERWGTNFSKHWLRISLMEPLAKKT